MKCNLILFFTVYVAELIHSTQLPDICEQLKNDPNVGILALVIVPIYRKLLLLTTNFFAIEVDFYTDVTYPSHVGYPEFRPLERKETWRVEITPKSTLFDVLTSEERRKYKSSSSPVPPAGFIIYNDMSIYYVVDANEMNSLFGQNYIEVGAGVERSFIWRALDHENVDKTIFVTSRPVEKTVCVSAQEPGRSFLVVVETDGKRCFQRTDFSAQTDGRLSTVSYSSAFGADCNSSISPRSVHLCGALINELLFAVDNGAKTISIYQDPILSNLTQLIQTVPFSDFFYCSHPWSLLTKAAIVLGTLLIIAAILFIVIKLFFWKGKKSKSQKSTSRTASTASIRSTKSSKSRVSKG